MAPNQFDTLTAPIEMQVRPRAPGGLDQHRGDRRVARRADHEPRERRGAPRADVLPNGFEYTRGRDGRTRSSARPPPRARCRLRSRTPTRSSTSSTGATPEGALTMTASARRMGPLCPQPGWADRRVAGACAGRLADHRPADGRDGRGPGHGPRDARVLHQRVGGDDGRDDVPLDRADGARLPDDRAPTPRAAAPARPGQHVDCSSPATSLRGRCSGCSPTRCSTACVRCRSAPSRGIAAVLTWRAACCWRRRSIS